MKQNKKIIGLAFAISFAFFAAGCSAVSGNPNKKSDQTTNKFTLNGTIALNGAYPTELVESLNQSAGNLTAASDARIATTSFSKVNAGNPKFYIEARKIADPDADPLTNGTVTKSSDGSFNYSFTFDLPEDERPEQWQLTVFLYFVNKDVCSYSGTVPVTLSKNGLLEEVPSIVLIKIDTVLNALINTTDPQDPNTSDPTDPTSGSEAMQIDLGVPGGINLKIYSQVEDIEYVSWLCDLEDGLYNFYHCEEEYVKTWLLSKGIYDEEYWIENISFKDGVATFNSRNVPNGFYNGTFYFYKKDADEPCLSINEIIYVYPGYITDSWYASNDSYIKKDEESGEYKFVITQDYLNKVSIASREVQDYDTPYILWDRDIDKDVCFFEPFETIDSNTALSPFSYSFLGFNKSPKFWFGCLPDDCNKYCIYYEVPSLQTTGVLNSIETSYAPGVFKEKQGTLNLQDLVKKTNEYIQFFNNQEVKICSYNISGQDAFIYWQAGDYVFFTMYDMKSNQNYSAVVLQAHNDFIVTKTYFDKNDQLYVYYLSNDKKEINQLFFKKYEAGNNFEYEGLLPEDKEQTWPHLELDFNNDGDGNAIEQPNIYKLSDDLDKDDKDDIYTGDLVFSDLMEQDGVVYALVKGYAIKKELYTKTITVNGDGTTSEDYNSFHDYPVSTGGVMKFERDYIHYPATWKDKSIILGLYTDLGDQMYYKRSYPDYYEISALPFPGQPPVNQDEKIYFYGAQRFVARKPDKLVIADDGGYTVDNNTYTRKKRVVTIDLMEESMSAMDVKAGFTTKFNASDGFFYEPS